MFASESHNNVRSKLQLSVWPGLHLTWLDPKIKLISSNGALRSSRGKLWDKNPARENSVCSR